MKTISCAFFSVILISFTTAFAGDNSELGSPLMDRVTRGCEKYAIKKTQDATENYFNFNFWAGGNVGAGSVSALQNDAAIYQRFIQTQCENMVAEVLELKLGYAPWQP